LGAIDQTLKIINERPLSAKAPSFSQEMLIILPKSTDFLGKKYGLLLKKVQTYFLKSPYFLKKSSEHIKE